MSQMSETTAVQKIIDEMNLWAKGYLAQANTDSELPKDKVARDQISRWRRWLWSIRSLCLPSMLTLFLPESVSWHRQPSEFSIPLSVSGGSVRKASGSVQRLSTRVLCLETSSTIMKTIQQRTDWITEPGNLVTLLCPTFLRWEHEQRMSKVAMNRYSTDIVRDLSVVDL